MKLEVSVAAAPPNGRPWGDERAPAGPAGDIDENKVMNSAAGA
jgi:hypothetical protein